MTPGHMLPTPHPANEVLRFTGGPQGQTAPPGWQQVLLHTLATTAIIIPYHHLLVIAILPCSLLSLQETVRVETGLLERQPRVDEISCLQKLL